MSVVDRNHLISFIAGSLYGESPLCIEDAVAGSLRLVDEFDDHGWTVKDGDPATEELRIEFDTTPVPTWLSIGPRRYDVVPAGAVERAVAEAVASTLTYVSTWQSDEDSVEDYRARADTIHALSGRWRDATCCPVCSEVVCDDDCPLYRLRDEAGVWVGSTGASSDVEEPEPGEYVEVDGIRLTAQSWLVSGLAQELADRFDEREADAGDEVVDCEIIDEEVETINDLMVSVQGSGESARFRWLGSDGVSPETALRHAAWIVALADPLDERFPIIKQAVQST